MKKSLNWSKPSFTCKHNWLYWQNHYYLAVGAGACGFLPDSRSEYGMRYKYLSRERSFCTQSVPELGYDSSLEREFSKEHFLIEARSAKIWLMEYIGVSLRHRKGLSLERVLAKTGFVFKPTVQVQQAISEGTLSIGDKHLRLKPSEWFREMSWCLLVFDCFNAG